MLKCLKHVSGEASCGGLPTAFEKKTTKLETAWKGHQRNYVAGVSLLPDENWAILAQSTEAEN